jgi:hypothetical protein
VIAVVGLSALIVIKNMLFGGHRAGVPAAEQTQAENAPLSDAERRDGIESLCKVFQIYGLPKTENDVAAAVKNAGELFKLGGGEAPGRGGYIFQSLAGEFRDKKLGGTDCAQAGAPLPTSDDTPQVAPSP